ncbi:histone-lysine N-methyltransferase NSD2 isoform X3 [Zootermopsis nevadensis]|uniref:histone-lysine N-methyltransferase NSD2 isoform X3 n=1 Tax=Zootermopsis nevadensis TaxID=136037 RepID=UPI000B8ECED4|nr:histone-lysine N-methyltransferase NSD2 isoform X3 [Zootermopsis nevadensis]
MGENDTSLEDPPPIMTKESDIELAALGKISLQKGERSVDASLNTLHSNPKRKHIEQGMELVTDSINQYQSDVSDISPCIIKSRYGRTHKPKIPEDFLPTDKKVAAILGHSPHKSPGKVTGSQVSVTAVEVAKVCQKGQGLFDIFVKKDRRSKGNTEMENVNRNSNTVKVGVCNVKSENRDTNSDNAESFSVRDEATSAGNDGLSPGIVKEEVKSDTTDKTCETSELSLCDEKMSGCDWVIGDLAWARVSGYPFWPCMIALDPQQRIFTKTTVRGNFTLRSLHVQFFGDNGRRSWLFSNCVIHFEGLEALNKLEAKVQSAMKKRDRKLAAAFHVAPKAKAKWNLAVKEAEAAVKKTRIERLKSFARQFPQDTSVKVAQTSNASPGRRQQKSVNDDRYNSSKMGSMEEGPHSPSSDVTDANDKDLSLSETPDSKFKISSPQAKKKKRQLKKYSFRGNNFGADFETFLCKHIHRVAQEHPELSTKAVEKYLAKEWSGMDEQQKSRFCSRLTGTNDTEKCTNMSSSEEEDDVDGDVDERQSNESEKADSNDTRDSSPAPFFKLRKGCGLFRGTRQEKVCQICEKPGDTVKCRGPCCGTFHIKCVSEYLAAKDNMNDITPSNVRIKKSKSVLTSHMNKVGINDVSFNVVDGDDKKVSEFTNVSEADGELTKPVSGIANLVEHGNKDEKECSRVSRKRKMFSTEEQICVANKKVDSRKDENEKVSEVKVDSCAVEGNEEEQEYKENVKQETVDELKMDVDKVNDIEELENDSTGTITKRDENQIVDVDEKEIEDDVRECSVIKEENHTEISSDEITKEVMEDVIKDKTVSDGRRSDRLKGRCYVENKEGKKDAEKGVFAKRGNQDEKGGGKSDCDGSENMMKDAGFCGEKDKYKRTTRLVAKKRDRRDDKEMKADGKEIQKQTKVTSEEKDRDEKKEKGVLKKKGKEEKKGKDGATEEKLVTDCASEFHCSDCKEGRNPPCFACGKIEEEKTGREQRQRCAVGHCGRFYHIECLKLWPHAWSSGSSSSRRQLAAAARGEVTGGQVAVTCPQHVCHTCASDDPRNATTRFAHERLVRCIRCPTAYHTGNYCLPAGSEVLTGTQIICPKHYEPPQKKTYHVNAAWCFICAMGGSLICCDLCPTSFHIECLRLSPPEGGFICEDCDTGRFPLYGEIVWVKLGAYRWWPAQILYPSQIPENIHNLPHVRGEFAVRFFGSHDYYWVNRGRVFLYQEGDTGHSARRKSYMEEMFSCALREANEAHKTLEGEKATRVAEARPVMVRCINT